MNIQIDEHRVIGLFKYIFFMDIILKWIAMYTDIRNGVISAILYILFIMLLLLSKKTISFNGLTKIYFVFLGYNCLMMFVSIFKGYPLNIIFSEVVNELFASISIFVGLKASDKQAKEFENVFFIVVAIILCSGLYYNLTLTDSYYIKFLSEYNPNFYLENFYDSPRLNSFVGSVVCGVYGCVLTCLSLKQLQKKDKISFLYYFLIGNMTAFFSLQRSAILVAILIDIFMLFYAYKKGLLKNIYIISLTMSIFIIVIIVTMYYEDVAIAIISRFLKIGDAVGERSSGWLNAFSNGILATIFGYGFATGSQRAIGISNLTVNDGQYFMFIYNIGFIGLFILLTIIWGSLYKKKGLYHICYSLALYGYILQMIGSNILVSMQTAVLFWYIIGRCNSIDRKDVIL